VDADLKSYYGTRIAPIVHETRISPIVRGTRISPIVRGTRIAPIVHETRISPISSDTRGADRGDLSGPRPAVVKIRAIRVPEDISTQPACRGVIRAIRVPWTIRAIRVWWSNLRNPRTYPVYAAPRASARRQARKKSNPPADQASRAVTQELEKPVFVARIRLADDAVSKEDRGQDACERGCAIMLSL
jgi:hypothetical protein